MISNSATLLYEYDRPAPWLLLLLLLLLLLVPLPAHSRERIIGCTDRIEEEIISTFVVVVFVCVMECSVMMECQECQECRGKSWSVMECHGVSC